MAGNKIQKHNDIYYKIITHPYQYRKASPEHTVAKINYSTSE